MSPSKQHPRYTPHEAVTAGYMSMEIKASSQERAFLLLRVMVRDVCLSQR